MDREIEKKGSAVEKKLTAVFEWMGKIPEALHSEKIIEGVKNLAVFSFSLLVSSASPMAAVYPFGIALICAMSKAGTAFAALLGSLSALFFMEENLLLYGAALLSVFFVRLALGALGLVKTSHLSASSGAWKAVRDSPLGTFAKSDSRIKNAFATSGLVKMICALGGAVTVGAGMIIVEGNLWYDVFATVLLTVSVPLFAFAFSAVGDEKYKTGLRKAGIAALAFAFFLSIRQFTLGGMNVGVVLAFLLSMTASVSFGISDGILFGLFILANLW